MSALPGPAPDMPVRWCLVVPVKESARAKSRLDPPHPLSRPALARAVAEDTLDQVCRALPPAQVVVVTSDPHVRKTAVAFGAQVLADPGLGLNPAVRAGWQSGEWQSVKGQDGATVGPGPTGWAALLGDLPALRAGDLAEALERCADYPGAAVPDAGGTGTVLLTSTTGLPEPRFGPGSAARHACNTRLLELDLPRLRRDVDTAADLAQAVSLGVGPRTAAALGLRVR